MTTSRKVFETWKLDILADYRLAPLLEKHFDKTAYLSDLLTENISTFSEVYAKLTSIKQSLVNIFNDKLTENHELITKDLEDLEAFELNLQDLKQGEKKVKTKALALHKDFSQEYENINKTLPILEKVYQVHNLSKNSCKFLQNVRLLRSLIVNGEIIDIKKGSLIINELFQLAKNSDFSGLGFYEFEKEFINSTRESLINKTQKRLISSLQAKQEEEVRTCLKTLQNLNILSEIVTQTGTTFLKNIMNIWKGFLIKEYDQNTVLLSFSLELKKVLEDCLEITSSVWLLKISLRNNEDLKVTDKNLINIFELFSSKEVNIIAQSFQKLRENSSKFELNWKVTIRSYPRIFHAFEDFLSRLREHFLLYPCSQDSSSNSISINTKTEKSDSDLKSAFNDFSRDFMGSISFLSELYYSWLSTELEIRFLGVISSIFNQDPVKNKDFIEQSFQNASRVLNFVQYELEDNVRTNNIFSRTSSIVSKELKTFLLVLLEKTMKEPLEDTLIGLYFSSLNVFAKICSDTMNFQLTNRHNLELSLEETDEFMDFYEEGLEKLAFRFLEKIFSELMKNFAMIFDTLNKGQKPSFQVGFWENINNILTQNNPLRLFNLPERNMVFGDNWEEFLVILCNLYGFMMSGLSSANEKVLEIVNKDIDVLNSIVERITRKDNSNKISMVVINVQKLFFLDAGNFTILSENNQNLFSLISKDLVVFHFLRRVEREHGMKRKNEGFIEILNGIVGSDTKYSRVKEFFRDLGERAIWKEALENLKKINTVNREHENIKLLEKLIGN